MYEADFLSRSYINDNVIDDPDLNEIIHSLTKYVQDSDERN